MERGILTITAGASAPAPALSERLWYGITRRCGEDVGRMIEALSAALEDREHPRDASYAPERYAERGSVEVVAVLAVLAPMLGAIIAVALAVLAHG